MSIASNHTYTWSLKSGQVPPGLNLSWHHWVGGPSFLSVHLHLIQLSRGVTESIIGGLWITRRQCSIRKDSGGVSPWAYVTTILRVGWDAVVKLRYVCTLLGSKILTGPMDRW